MIICRLILPCRHPVPGVEVDVAVGGLRAAVAKPISDHVVVQASPAKLGAAGVAGGDGSGHVDPQLIKGSDNKLVERVIFQIQSFWDGSAGICCSTISRARGVASRRLLFCCLAQA